MMSMEANPCPEEQHPGKGLHRKSEAHAYSCTQGANLQRLPIERHVGVEGVAQRNTIILIVKPQGMNSNLRCSVQRSGS